MQQDPITLYSTGKGLQELIINNCSETNLYFPRPGLCSWFFNISEQAMQWSYSVISRLEIIPSVQVLSLCMCPRFTTSNQSLHYCWPGRIVRLNIASQILLDIYPVIMPPYPPRYRHIVINFAMTKLSLLQCLAPFPSPFPTTVVTTPFKGSPHKYSIERLLLILYLFKRAIWQF